VTTVPDHDDIDAYRRHARAWLEDNLERRVDSPDQANLFEAVERSADELAAQRALQRRIFEAGYAGISWPREYGGQGLSREHEIAFQEEAEDFVLPDFGIVGGTTFAVCAPTMLAHGSGAFLRTHVPRILAGDELVVQFFSDPEAGSDLAGVRTQATRDGDRWILNGSKIWSSGAYYADCGMCLARTNWDVPKHRGLTWFMVPIAARGVTVRRIKQINGDAEFCQEFFDDVELTDDDVIGEVDGGWAVAQSMLLFERGGGGREWPLRAPDPRRIAPDLVELAASAGTLDDSFTRDLVVRAHVDDVVRDQLMARIGEMMRADPVRAVATASYGKLAAGTYDPIRANLELEIAGDAAAAWADPSSPGARAGHAFLTGRFMAIAGGTNEMQRNGIGERVLGLPQEPSFDRSKPFREVVRDARNWSGKVS
jgi:alkylation response protein AidB-like acyl-CoA dehydrogenase